MERQLCANHDAPFNPFSLYVNIVSAMCHSEARDGSFLNFGYTSTAGLKAHILQFFLQFIPSNHTLIKCLLFSIPRQVCWTVQNPDRIHSSKMVGHVRRFGHGQVPQVSTYLRKLACPDMSA
jgi:hypothetical protein